ncbi:MAG: aldehyde dehydrogenase [Bacteroidales bacterium]|nr:aldehyde dehydrogenase [Bacteroidales bacterium]
MENTSLEQIKTIVAKQQSFFKTGKTKDLCFRKQALKNFLSAVEKNEQAIADALWKDLHKSYEEAYLTEISLVKGEIKNHIRHLRKWAKPQCVLSPLALFPSSSKIISEPLGCSLIIAPWNYPVLLLLSPLIGAISAGCTAILKPSPYVPNVSRIMQEIIESTFSDEYIAVVQGNREVNSQLLEQKFDIIFFTGSPDLGKIVMGAAAKNLTPVVLELGGKSPCFVSEDANITLAARRIAWGKCLNAGQTCIAPDYLLVHENVKDAFIAEFKKALQKFYAENPQASKHFVRLVSEKAYQRVKSYLSDGNAIVGGKFDDAERYIEPTILENVSPDSPVMTTEIFGPILPMLTYKDIDEAIAFVNSRPKPLALYAFGANKTTKKILKETTSGGACVNDTIMHIVNHNMPFGGVGNSGLGKYHGKLSFDAFSNKRAVVFTPTWIDLPVRYMPYKFFLLMKQIL